MSQAKYEHCPDCGEYLIYQHMRDHNSGTLYSFPLKDQRYLKLVAPEDGGHKCVPAPPAAKGDGG